MRNLFYGISLIGILLSFPILLIGQILDQELYSYDCIDEEDNAFIDTIYRGLYESRNGASHSPHAEIRFLVAFKVCLLSIAPISVNDIAVISGLSIDTISKSRSNIRKKLKIEDNKRTSISEYILKEKMNIDLQP